MEKALRLLYASLGASTSKRYWRSDDLPARLPALEISFS